MLPSDRRTFLGVLSSLTGWTRLARRPAQQPAIDVRPTAHFQQPEGRKNLVRITVSGLSAPAARARVTDRRGALVGTAGLLPAAQGPALTGEVWVPLSEPSDFQVDVEVGRERVARRRLRLTPAKRWTLYWLASIHTDVGYTDLQERALEIHRRNLDAALAWTTTHRDFHFTAECALQVLSYLENRSPEAGDALVQAIRDGKIGWQALFANMLTGILDHETFARLVWPAGKLARERGLPFVSAQITDVPGQSLTFPMLLAASGVKYLASGPNPERAAPLLPSGTGGTGGTGTEGTLYPQLYYWEGPDGSRVLHWRAHHYGDGTRFGFDVGPDEMGHRLSDWLLNQPAFLAQNWPYDSALLYGADWHDNALMKEAVVANVQEFGRRFTPDRGAMGVQTALHRRRGGCRARSAERCAAPVGARVAAGARPPRVQCGNVGTHGRGARGRRRRQAALERGARAGVGGSRRRRRVGPVPRGAAARLSRLERSRRRTPAPNRGWRRARCQSRRIRGADRSSDRCDPLTHGSGRQGAREDHGVVGVESAGLRPWRRAQRAVDLGRPRRPQESAATRPHPDQVRAVSSRTAPRDWRPPRRGSRAGRLSGDHLDRHALRRAAVGRHRESDHEDGDARKRGALRRLPVRIHQAHRGSRGFPRADDRRWRSAAR